MRKVRIRFFEEKHDGMKKQVGPALEFLYTQGRVSLFSQAYLRASPKQRACYILKVSELQ